MNVAQYIASRTGNTSVSLRAVCHLLVWSNFCSDCLWSLSGMREVVSRVWLLLVVDRGGLVVGEVCIGDGVGSFRCLELFGVASSKKKRTSS